MNSDDDFDVGRNVFDILPTLQEESVTTGDYPVIAEPLPEANSREGFDAWSVRQAVAFTDRIGGLGYSFDRAGDDQSGNPEEREEPSSVDNQPLNEVEKTLLQVTIDDLTEGASLEISERVRRAFLEFRNQLQDLLDEHAPKDEPREIEMRETRSMRASHPGASHIPVSTVRVSNPAAIREEYFPSLENRVSLRIVAEEVETGLSGAPLSGYVSPPRGDFAGDRINTNPTQSRLRPGERYQLSLDDLMTGQLRVPGLTRANLDDLNSGIDFHIREEDVELTGDYQAVPLPIVPPYELTWEDYISSRVLVIGSMQHTDVGDIHGIGFSGDEIEELRMRGRVLVPRSIIHGPLEDS